MNFKALGRADCQIETVLYASFESIANVGSGAARRSQSIYSVVESRAVVDQGYNHSSSSGIVVRSPRSRWPEGEPGWCDNTLGKAP